MSDFMSDGESATFAAVRRIGAGSRNSGGASAVASLRAFAAGVAGAEGAVTTAGTLSANGWTASTVCSVSDVTASVPAKRHTTLETPATNTNDAAATILRSLHQRRVVALRRARRAAS